MTSPTIPPALTESMNTPIVTDPRQWGPMLDLPCNLTLDLSVPHFTVSDLLRLESGVVLETKWVSGDDVPVRINGQLVAWAEFEVVGNCLAVRITEWA